MCPNSNDAKEQDAKALASGSSQTSALRPADYAEAESLRPEGMCLGVAIVKHPCNKAV